jgi:hypothetical protein
MEAYEPSGITRCMSRLKGNKATTAFDDIFIGP